jgi:hypothetical protein
MIKNPTFIKFIELKKLPDMPPTLRNCQCPEYDVCLNTAAIQNCDLHCNECPLKDMKLF